MTQQDTNNLKAEIKFLIEDCGMGFLHIGWFKDIKQKCQWTLDEYVMDSQLSRREVIGMLYHNQDNKLWDIIMNTTL